MKYIKVTNIKLNMNQTEQDAIAEAMRMARISKENLVDARIMKYSIDARKKPQVKKLFTVLLTAKKASAKGKNIQILEKLPKYEQEVLGTKKLSHSPVVVGFGPAGMFCAYLLAKNGYRPVVIERGAKVEQRIQDVEQFWKFGTLKEHSNVQFGEGGAGTFSDGKLNTGIKDKRHRIQFVLDTFVAFGAKENIAYDAKPHIGTDILCHVVRNMREEIISLGGTFLFDSTVTDFRIENNQITGVQINEKEWIDTSLCILAIGHSARDTFRRLYEKGIAMEQKPFAMGVRVEHLQKMMNRSQYGMEETSLGAAPYKVTYHTEKNRGVYSFCMCPGGYVVNASSQKGRLCINGMSYQKRDSKNANSAIVTTIQPEDFPSRHVLAGVEMQEALEEKTYQWCSGKIPVQRLEDFLKGQKTTAFGSVTPEMKGNYALADLNGLLPKEMEEAIKEAMTAFGNSIEGFDHPDTLLSAIESRTSSPVRILRDDSFQTNVVGIYPAGEGAGYAGGITSAAIDGMKIFEQISSEYCPFE